MTALSKSDYLKRYLDNSEFESGKKKKSRKKTKIGKVSVQVIDEDIPGWKEDNIDLEQIANCEDAPQIIVEDKKQINTDFSNKKLWKTVGEDDDDKNENVDNHPLSNDKGEKLSEQKKQKKPKQTFNLGGSQMEVIYRDRAGRIRDLKREKEENESKIKKQQEFEDLYKDWGKGLKQKDDKQKQMMDDLYESSKPVARYADDADLEQHLKSKQRLDDPMAKYFREKTIQDDFESKKMVKPTYKGQYLPNRYDIPPGYRWDGVDRSNGYEKKWYEAQNKRKSQIIEYRMWSMEDM